MRDVLGQAKAATADLRGAVDSFAPQVRRLSGYLQEIDAGFRGSVALLGRWFWWPHLPSRLPGRRFSAAQVQ
jgi:hypothetical protein